eukprot:1136199-Pelagomonas_calceolata.AAC.3
MTRYKYSWKLGSHEFDHIPSTKPSSPSFPTHAALPASYIHIEKNCPLPYRTGGILGRSVNPVQKITTDELLVKYYLTSSWSKHKKKSTRTLTTLGEQWASEKKHLRQGIITIAKQMHGHV